ncbi:MAG: hypothetical protein CSA60_04350 [Neptuniibacter caesariensis]|uniref:Cds6 C-terminal domain-containing protein n=1 Tax=Neptuniibacter caesariensis TaxID=207954 RepID=A0A2G6JM44_NEPCE|nr:MAG: hypothetical protein CSA60_04350 [Neptuniibacter caesariensis]
MLKFKVNTGKRLLKATIGTLVSASFLTGCSPLSNTTAKPQVTQQPTQNQAGYCYKGGKTHDYSCDPEKAAAQPDLRSQEIDEEWMKSKLAEVKTWIAQEKQALIDGRAPKPASADSRASTDNTTSYLTTVSIANPVSAMTTPEIERSLQLSLKQQHNEALSSINTLLSRQPNMAAAHLAKGIILSNMGRKAEAKQIFQRLTKTYPDRPEAFNNLAVIYADEGNYPAAIETLQQAFQTHPSYAQVHRNLKELYATLASQAYNKALDLGSSSAGPELAMINQSSPSQHSERDTQLTIASTQHSAQLVTPPVDSTEVNIETSTPTTVVKAETDSSTARQPEVIAQIGDKAEPIEVAATTKASANPLPESETKPAVASSIAAHEQAILQHLNDWSSAWSAKDYQSYIASYTNEYRPNAKLTHTQWVDQRRQRLSKPKFIRVTLNNIQVNLLRDNLAEARFAQYYQSNTYKDAVRKRMMLVKTSDGWKISLERSLGLL